MPMHVGLEATPSLVAAATRLFGLSSVSSRAMVDFLTSACTMADRVKPRIRDHATRQVMDPAAPSVSRIPCQIRFMPALSRLSPCSSTVVQSGRWREQWDGRRTTVSGADEGSVTGHRSSNERSVNCLQASSSRSKIATAGVAPGASRVTTSSRASRGSSSLAGVAMPCPRPRSTISSFR